MTRLFTIGHSTRHIDEFVDTLTSFDVDVLADVRRFPTSRRHPAYKTVPLKKSLFHAGVKYDFFGDELGGYRETGPSSPHVGLGDSGFRGYADWTDSAMFRAGVQRLLELAARKRVAVMCAERQPASCHRRVLSDYVAVAHGWSVEHLLDPHESKPHVPQRGIQRAGQGVVYALPEGNGLDDFSEHAREQTGV